MLAGAIALAVGACTPTARLDTSTPARFSATVAEAAKLAPGQAEQLQAAAKTFSDAYFAETPADGLPPREATRGMRASDLPSFVARHLTPSETIERKATFPDPWLAEQLSAAMSTEYQLLTERRTEASKSVMFTVDQYEIEDFVLIPPTDNLPLAEDKVRFLVTLTNHTNLDANQPTFQVRVSVDGELQPRLNRAFELAALKEPIAAGETRRIAFSCCSLATESYLNNKLRTLPSHAQIEVSLTRMLDVKQRELFDATRYSLTDHQRRMRAKACADFLDKNASTWVPGEVGDPCGTSLEQFESDAGPAVASAASSDAGA